MGRERKRLLISGLLVGLPLLLLLLDTAARTLQGWRPGGWLERIVAVALGLATVAWWGGLLTARTRRLLARAWAPLTLASVSLAAVVLAFELAITEAPFHLRRPGQVTVFHPDLRWLPGVSGDGRLATNALGIRGDPLPERAAAWRLLCVGGSTTECLYLDDGETWPRLLQDHLAARWKRPVWVGNVGISGYATTEHLPFLEQFEHLEQMDQVLVMAGFNDLVLTALGGRRPILAPRVEPRWSRWDATVLLKRVQESFRGVPFQDPAGQWIEERRKLRRPAPRVPDLPDLGPECDAFEARLEAIVALCRTRGVQVALATQAVLWRADLEPAGEELLWCGWTRDRRSYYTAGALRGAMERFNQRVAAVAARNGLPLVDVAALPSETSLFYDDCHFTEEGARRVAEIVARALPAPR